MDTFGKILKEKLKKQEISIDEMPSESLREAFGQTMTTNDLGVDLLKWLNSSPLAKKSYYKVEDSSYSIYKKDPKVLEKEKHEREERTLAIFLAQLPSEEHKKSARFLYSQGARAFMSLNLASLKKDYRKLALKLHPDRHFNEIPSVQRRYQEDFRQLQESFESLKTHVFSL